MLRTPAAVLAAAMIASAAAAQPTGIAACDDFLTKYETCLNIKIPAAEKFIHKGIIDEMRRDIKEKAKNPQLKELAEFTCKTAVEQFTRLVQPYGCTLGATTIATGAIAQSTGVPVCDDFLKKYEICVDTKMPADQRDLHKGVIDHFRKTFADVAKSPGGKSSAESGCKQAVEGVKALLQSVGCTF